MNVLTDAVNWVVAHPFTALSYLSLVHMIASAVANATPTKSDDVVVEKVYKAIHGLALNFFAFRGVKLPASCDEKEVQK